MRRPDRWTYVFGAWRVATAVSCVGRAPRPGRRARGSTIGSCDRGGAPDPLVARADEGTAGALVVAAPDVEAGVLRVAQHRLDLRAAPGLGQVVLVLACCASAAGSGRGRALSLSQIAPRPSPCRPVVQSKIIDGRSARDTGSRTSRCLLAAFACAFVRVGVVVRLELVAVGGRPAGVPALADRSLPCRARLFSIRFADVPLGDALLHPPRQRSRWRSRSRGSSAAKSSDVERARVPAPDGSRR